LFVVLLPHLRFAKSVAEKQTRRARGMRYVRVAAMGATALNRLLNGEVPIRTLSVSLVAVAAIAASLLLTMDREERETAGIAPAGENVPNRAKLDAIRAAGL
jgi:hypothetical protein